MKNIYEIIAEQKMMVDINIASYDLQYASTYLVESSEEYYIEEGLGETVKKIGNTIVEFIKTIITKVKEIINKVIDFLFKKEDTVNRINNEIKAANNGETSKNNDHDGAEAVKAAKAAADEQKKRTDEALKERDARIRKEQEEKARQEKQASRDKIQQEKEKRKSIKKAYKKVNDIEGLLKQSDDKVSVRYFCPLQRKVDLANKFFANMDNVSRELISKKIINDDILIMHVIDKTFRGRGSFDANNGSAMEITKRIELEIGEDNHEPREYTVSTIADDMIGYLNNGKGAGRYLRAKEKSIVDALNKLLKMAEQENGSDKHKSLIKAAAGAIGEFVSVLCSSIARALNASVAIAEKVKNDYVNSIKH